MLVFHGSDQEIQKPELYYGRFNLDFGRGFYVTSLQEQAEKWARRRAAVSHRQPNVSIYKFDTSQLNILYFDGYTEQWLDFVVVNRAGTEVVHGYDAIFGNIANDDVATVVNDYMRLMKMGRISASGKQFYLEQLQYSKPNNQFCIATQKGIDSLVFFESYVPEG